MVLWVVVTFFLTFSESKGETSTVTDIWLYGYAAAGKGMVFKPLSLV